MKRSLFNLLALGSLLIPVFTACGDDEDDSNTAKPAGPPSIRISGFIGADNRVTKRADENALEVCGERFGVVVEIPDDTWTLRPPGRCGATAQCGYVAITLDPESGAPIVENSINRATMLDLSGAPVFEGGGGAGGEGARGGAPGDGEPTIAEGLHAVRVELRNDDGTAFLDATGAAVADEAEVELSFVTCPSSGSGSGGEGGQPGAAGAPAGGAAGAPAGGAGGGGDGLGGEGGAGAGGRTGIGGGGGA